MILDLESYIADPASIGKTYSHGGKTFKVAKADNFEYTDPIDQSVSKKQVRLSCGTSEYIGICHIARPLVYLFLANRIYVIS